MQAKAGPRATRQRVRPLLLVLLWVWAGCIALVLDLFLNVEELDSIRPRAPLYRAMRHVAHDMVGEPILDGDSSPAVTAKALPSGRTARATSAPAGTRAIPSSRHPGGRPDLRTPQGRRLLEQLRHAAANEDDPDKRAGALRSLEAMFGKRGAFGAALRADGRRWPTARQRSARQDHK